jgi:hypothetical protein
VQEMTTIYKKKVLKEIETIPDKHFKSLYKMIHYFKIELKSGGGKNVKKYSLAGIWKGSQIDDNLIRNAKKTIFPYETE